MTDEELDAYWAEARKNRRSFDFIYDLYQRFGAHAMSNDEIDEADPRLARDVLDVLSLLVDELDPGEEA
jgi:hypothetical protein